MQVNNFDTSSQIIVTGAAGFIGSCMVQYLNENGYENLILVDDFGVEAKRINWQSKSFAHIVERYNLFDWLELHQEKIAFVFHLGARTDTTEFDYSIHQELNVEYSQKIWNYCTAHQVPLVYASSAATYGGGGFGYDDDHDIIEKLHPLNPYGISKNEFDKWVLGEAAPTASPTASPNLPTHREALDPENLETSGIMSDSAQNPPSEGREANSLDGREANPSEGRQAFSPPFWAGLKFFNVYGPNEYHKGRMASVIWHSFNQITENGQVKLFKSHRPDFEDGQQLRDFVYVKDVVKVMYWMMLQTSTDDGRPLTEVEPGGSRLAVDGRLKSAIYNLGTGKARSFYDLAASTFRGLDLQPDIAFIPMPEDIRDKYQYFTEANMKKLQDVGYIEPFYSLEAGIDDYVRQYLKPGKIY